MPAFAALQFDDSFVRTLPADAGTGLRPRQVSAACYSHVTPTPVADPRLVAWSPAVARLLGMEREPTGDAVLAAVLGGCRVLPGMRPYSARYGGHQFGHWAGQLGDGRAITLAEILGPDSRRWEIQLKGAGLTPYSRTADGRAVLRSSVREFLCSEAMHYLGVPTTRALSLVTTGERVVRDMFYDGHPRSEPGAVVCRVAPSFLRFGNFEILAAAGEDALLQRLLDYAVTHHFDGWQAGGGAPTPEVYARWFIQICERTAELVAHWLRVGFVHGVMNTDNMAILGLTIDYGPYGWLEGYDPYWTPNTTDAGQRRYCFANQVPVALWNLECLGEALQPLFKTHGIDAAIAAGLERFRTHFTAVHTQMLADKLGLTALRDDDDARLVNDLVALLAAAETDMTIFYRQLHAVASLAPRPADVVPEPADLLAPVTAAFYQPDAVPAAHGRDLGAWLQRYHARFVADPTPAAARLATMQRTNPKYVLRNYLAQQAIEALEQHGDAGLLTQLGTLLQQPYAEQPGNEHFAARRPEWAPHKAGCSALSCSS